MKFYEEYVKNNFGINQLKLDFTLISDIEFGETSKNALKNEVDFKMK